MLTTRRETAEHIVIMIRGAARRRRGATRGIETTRKRRDEMEMKKEAVTYRIHDSADVIGVQTIRRIVQPV